MNDRFLSLLGLCRKAGMISFGHDASVAELHKRTAKLCLLTRDASERLKEEFARAIERTGIEITATNIDYTMEEINRATGRRAAVMTINDEGFAKKAVELLCKHGED